MNTALNSLIDDTNFIKTENGAIAHKTTKSDVLDMFALCGAYRNRSDDDCILAFKKALEENESLAMKCLFYLGDCRGGQGERRFFRVCFNWLAKTNPELAKKHIKFIPEYRRWDDVIYACADTPIEKDAFNFIKQQLILDMQSKTPSLLAKWLPSENASSVITKKMGTKIRLYLQMTHKQYRKTLSELRSRINIVEKLMSENRWDEIEFDKIPSIAGFKYKNAFAYKDVIAEKYKAFMQDKNTKVNAEVLDPMHIAKEALEGNTMMDHQTMVNTLQKYWDNLKDYYNGRKENGIAVVDVSGSMEGTPLYAAISMGAYIAEKSSKDSPFYNYFITFSGSPSLVRFEGTDIVDKFKRAVGADWGFNTDIKKVFDLLLKTAKKKSTKPEDMPERLYIFSDMEFDSATDMDLNDADTLLEQIAKQWKQEGYELPKLIFWNLDSRQQNIPALGDRISYVSGFSMSMVETILSGRDGFDLMLEKLLSKRYEPIGV